MPPMPKRLPFLAALATAVVLAAGCSNDGDDAPPEPQETPDVTELMSAAADRMAQVETVRLRIEADADIADLPLRAADAVVTSAGDAEGTAEVEQLGQLLEIQFVLVEDTFHYQLVGQWLEMPRTDAAQLYDPSAILDPDQGIANLIRTAQEPEISGTSTVDGVQAYEVSATFGAAELAGVLPGVPDGLPGTLWIGVDEPLLHQAEFTPTGGTVTVNLSDFDAPADITAP